MAVSNQVARDESLVGSEMDALKTNFNALLLRFDALLAKMDADFADVANASVDYQSVVNDGSFKTVNYEA